MISQHWKLSTTQTSDDGTLGRWQMLFNFYWQFYDQGNDKISSRLCNFHHNSWYIHTYKRQSCERLGKSQVEEWINLQYHDGWKLGSFEDTRWIASDFPWPRSEWKLPPARVGGGKWRPIRGHYLGRGQNTLVTLLWWQIEALVHWSSLRLYCG